MAKTMDVCSCELLVYAITSRTHKFIGGFIHASDTEFPVVRALLY